jgi:membrane protein CcdC involved in cytochrome C biogenesis
MKSLTLVLHLLAIVTAAWCLWSMRHELTKRPTNRMGFAIPPILAVVTALLLMGVSLGKRLDFWLLTILAGFVVGIGAGMILKVDKDFERRIVRVWRTYDGVAAGGLLLLLAIARFITTDVMGRVSQGFGVLAGTAAFLAAFLVGRVVSLRYYTARKAIHLDMKRRD